MSRIMSYIICGIILLFFPPLAFPNVKAEVIDNAFLKVTYSYNYTFDSIRHENW